MSSGAARPDEPPPRQTNPNASHNELSHNDQPIELLARAYSTDAQKPLASCMIQARARRERKAEADPAQLELPFIRNKRT
jgi:hypothetical protein